MIEEFKRDVREGLTKKSKTLPSKYFYNKEGDRLFQQIMQLPEYYLTRAEDEIFTQKSEEIVSALNFEKGHHFELIELGAGDGSKTIKLLSALLNNGYDFTYVPIDISASVLEQLSEKLHQELPNLRVESRQGTYFGVLEQLNKPDVSKVILFLGSNIGNLLDDQAQDFIQKLGNNLSEGDQLLLGVDLIKPREIVLPAYNDPKGVTKAFNLNLLKRINNELAANFDIDGFDHSPRYDEETGVALSYIKSLRQQEVRIDEIDLVVSFAEGELIHTEISRKYNETILNGIMEGSGFELQKKFKDQNELFCDYLLKLC